MTRTALVGYDARELWLDTDLQWTDDKKHEYLLHNNITKPLSVDSYIWYSVFSEESTPRIWQDIPRKSTYQTVEWDNTFMESRQLVLPDIYRPRTIWTSLNSLRSYIADNWKNDWKPCAIIAVQEVFLESEEEDEEPVNIEPNVVDESWKLLGYDVADYELYTGLHGGLPVTGLADQIKPEWIEKLNEFHLFTDPQVAFDYIEFANIRKASHQPYYVYGLYLVETKRVTSFP